MITLAWRNIWRKRWRSLFTAGAVALVVLLTVIYFGFVGAARNGIYSNLTASAGHLQVRVEGYRDLKDFSDLLVRDAGALEEKVAGVLARRDDKAELVAALEVPGLLEGKGRSRGVMLVALDQPPELRQKFLKDNQVEGDFPAADDLESIVLGRKLARAIKVGIGDTVFMYAPGTEGYGAAAYLVSGFLDAPGTSQLAYVSLAAAQELAAPDSLSRLEIHLPDFKRLADDEALPAIAQDLQAVIGEGYSAESWRQVNPSIAALLDLQASASVINTLIFFVLAGLLVMNTIYLSIIERIREFGIIMALGAARLKMIAMVLSESILLCFSGAAAGAAGGLAVVAYMSRGFSFPPALAELYAEAGLPTVLFASVSLQQFLITIAFVLATGILAALLPAFTAARLEPVEAMRFTA